MRHRHIGDDEINGGFPGEQLKRPLAGASFEHLVPQVLQHHDGVEEHERVVVHRQHDAGGCPGLPVGRGQGRLARRGVQHAQREVREQCAAPALEDQAAARLDRHAVHHGEAEARALSWALSAVERLRGPGKRRLVHANTRVSHRKTGVIPRAQSMHLPGREMRLANLNHDDAPARHGVPRVHRQIQQGHLELIFIDQNRDGLWG